MIELGRYLDIKLFQADPCQFLENLIKDYVRTSPLNHLITFNNEPIFDDPIVVFACGDNPAFQNLKTIVGEFHLTPREAKMHVTLTLQVLFYLWAGHMNFPDLRSRAACISGTLNNNWTHSKLCTNKALLNLY